MPEPPDPWPEDQSTVTIRVLIVDDRAGLRRLIASAVELDSRFAVAGQAGDGVQAVEAAEQLKPDAVILDQQMPHMTGLDALPRLRAVLPDAAIVLFSSADLREVEQPALLAGADACVDKEQSVDAVLDIVVTALSGRRSSQS